jgi:transcriptional/translational regulatory protein YebC/TACO1
VGSVSYLFSQLGVLNYPSGTDEDAIMEAALDAGADDVVTDDDGSIEVITTQESFVDVKEAMVSASLEPAHSEVTMRASTEVSLDVEQGEKLLKLIDALEDLDDVQDVFTNADIPGEAYT